MEALEDGNNLEAGTGVVRTGNGDMGPGVMQQDSVSVSSNEDRGPLTTESAAVDEEQPPPPPPSLPPSEVQNGSAEVLEASVVDDGAKSVADMKGWLVWLVGLFVWLVGLGSALFSLSFCGAFASVVAFVF
jgi:hypothetical protein